MRQSYLNRNPYTGKTTTLYWYWLLTWSPSYCQAWYCPCVGRSFISFSINDGMIKDNSNLIEIFILLWSKFLSARTASSHHQCGKKFLEHSPENRYPLYVLYKIPLAQANFYSPNSKCTRIGEQASISFPHWSSYKIRSSSYQVHLSLQRVHL